MNPTTPVTRSHIAWIAAVLWIALLAAVIGVGLVSGRLGNSSSNLSVQGQPGAQSVVPAADPSASPSTPVKPGTAGPKPGRGPAAFGGRGGFGAFGGPGGFGGVFGGRGFAGPRGAITIAAIKGTQLSLTTVDGWARTIDASGATIHNGGQTAALADLKVGDQIVFRQTRNADGTFTVTDITIVQPQVTGTVGSVNGSTFTVKLADGTSTSVQTDGSTTYRAAGQKTATIAAITAGLWVHVTGRRNDDGSITATAVQVAPVVMAGQVTAKDTSSITIKTLAGQTATIHVDSSTSYQARGNSSASLNDVAVDGWIAAQGSLNADGSLNATTVRLFPGLKPRGNGAPQGRNPFSGPPRGFGGGPSKGAPSAPPAPTT